MRSNVGCDNVEDRLRVDAEEDRQHGQRHQRQQLLAGQVAARPDTVSVIVVRAHARASRR